MSVAKSADRLAAEEAELVAQIAAGDSGEVAAALGELVGRYNKRLYAVGFRLLGNASLVDEMVQETWVKVWQYAGRFDAGKASFSTFVMVVAHSVAMDVRKRVSSRQYPRLDEVDLPPVADSVEQIGDRLAITDAMDSLSPNHAEVLRLAHVEGLTQREIAKRLDISLGTVKSRMFFGMKAAQAALMERGFHGA